MSPRLKRWAPIKSRDQRSVLVPLLEKAPDYHDLLAAAFEAAAMLLGTSVAEIVRRVFLARADVVEVTAEVEPAVDGTVPILDGLRVIQSGFDLLEASSLAHGERRAYWGGPRPRQTVRLMERIRLGVPQVGSYVIPVVVPLTLPVPTPSNLSIGAGDPYERSVTRTLATALLAARSAAEESRPGDLRPFQDAVAQGVSANLCAAIGDLANVASLTGVRFSVDWAHIADLVPPPSSVPVHIPRALLPVLADGAAFLTPKDADRQVSLVGQVEHLDRAEDELEGTIGIRTSIDGESRMVYLDLSEDLYSRAVQAHDHRNLVLCRGVLHRQGRRRSMTNVSYLTIEDVLS